MDGMAWRRVKLDTNPDTIPDSIAQHCTAHLPALNCCNPRDESQAYMVQSQHN